MGKGGSHSAQDSCSWLNESDFHQVIVHAPLISLDFIVTNTQGQWLLGQRSNRPAKGSWFVPGGRVLKNETLDNAARRLTENELGEIYELNAMRFLGVYQHFYTDSIASPDVSTHYVVLAYQFQSSLDLEALPHHQHDRYCWWTADGIERDERVHDNTRAYLPPVLSIM